MSSPSVSVLDAESLRRALCVRDLTDPAQGPHALQLLLDDALAALSAHWSCEVRVVRSSPVVSVADNYDRLHYPPGGAARDARYTRYVCEGALLRTQTSAMVPPALRQLAKEPARDVLLACPGLVYRRDCIDRLHTGEPHQLDLWYLRHGAPLGPAHLRELAARVVEALLPGRALHLTPAVHPYTTDGLQLDVVDGETQVEVGECGLALPALLAESGLDPRRTTGLAMGLGLDRLLMLRKGLPDIRLLRSEDPRIAAQLRTLAPWVPVSAMPPVRRDLSLVVAADTTGEELGDRVRAALGERAQWVESVEVRAETPWAALPEAARARLGLTPQQKNVLLRVTLRALERTLTHAECNTLRDEVYAALHQGPHWEWAASPQPRGAASPSTHRSSAAVSEKSPS